jgi:hypothetical protein
LEVYINEPNISEYGSGFCPLLAASSLLYNGNVTTSLGALNNSGTVYYTTPQGTDLSLAADAGTGDIDAVSMGVDGVATPEPSPFVPLIAIAVGVGLNRRRATLLQQGTQCRQRD